MVNNVRGDILWGDSVHHDNGMYFKCDGYYLYSQVMVVLIRGIYIPWLFISQNILNEVTLERGKISTALI